jgi:hypothetical protein
MPPKIKKRQENLLAKIAQHLGKDLEEVKEAALPLYSYEEEVMERQSIINFFKARVRPERQRITVNGKSRLETDAEFEKRYNEWRFKECRNCNRMFAYAYSYDGVAFCSLDCLDEDLKKMGLELTRNRDVKKRWGLTRPAVVPAPVLELLQDAYPNHEGTFDVPVQTVLPKLRQEQHSD